MNDDPTSVWRRATGYLELSMPEEALAELEDAPTKDKQTMLLKVDALFKLQRWPEASAICLPMLESDPGQAGWWIQAAYATRRAEGIEQAEPILEKAAEHHPKHPLIAYNRACYAAVQGRREEAIDFLTTAIEIDRNSTLEMASKDNDLVDLRPWIQEQMS